MGVIGRKISIYRIEDICTLGKPKCERNILDTGQEQGKRNETPWYNAQIPRYNKLDDAVFYDSWRLNSLLKPRYRMLCEVKYDESRMLADARQKSREE